IEVLKDRTGATGDTNILVAGGFARLTQCALEAVVDKEKRRAPEPLPRVAHLMGHYKDRRVEGRILRPVVLASVEHPLAHDVGAGAMKHSFKELVVDAGLSALTQIEVFTEKLLLKLPILELAPPLEPILVTWVVGVF